VRSDPHDLSFVFMKSLGRFTMSLLCSVVALTVSFYIGSLFLLLFDSRYHDGFAAVGGLIIGLIAAVFAFRAVWKKLAASGVKPA
jgi:hypothetical protein